MCGGSISYSPQKGIEHKTDGTHHTVSDKLQCVPKQSIKVCCEDPEYFSKKSSENAEEHLIRSAFNTRFSRNI